MKSTKKASSATIRAPYHPVTQPHEIGSALMEILQLAIKQNDKMTETLARSIITTSFTHKIDWTKLGQEVTQ
jgi:hypothetical protein